VDVADLIQAQDLDVYDEKGEAAHDIYLDAIEDAKQETSHIGISWRWGLAASEDGASIELQLQALPCNGSALKSNPAFQEDNLAVVVLTSFPVETNLFDGGRAAGPVPTLFSSNPADTVQRLKASPEMAHQLCQALASRLLSTEMLSAVEAWEIGAVPREGRASSPFIRAFTELIQPAQKRLREADPAEGPSSNPYTGTLHIISMIPSGNYCNLIIEMYLCIILQDLNRKLFRRAC
jgi:hypothetical protein